MAAARRTAVFFQPMCPLGDRRRSSCETSMSGTRGASLWSEQHRQIKCVVGAKLASAELRPANQSVKSIKGTSGGTQSSTRSLLEHGQGRRQWRL